MKIKYVEFYDLPFLKKIFKTVIFLLKIATPAVVGVPPTALFRTSQEVARKKVFSLNAFNDHEIDVGAEG